MKAKLQMPRLETSSKDRAAHGTDVPRSGAAVARAAKGERMFRGVLLAVRVFMLLIGLSMAPGRIAQAQEQTIVCVPSLRTVAPCPAGYAPKEISIQSSHTPDIYGTTLDALPLQEMIYALSIGIAGLMGFSVGVRLS
jgi:ABC-type Na+ efflux pump permease subunit